MGKSKHIALIVLVSLALLIAVATVPGMVRALAQKRSFDRTFSNYSQALTSGDFQAAYKSAGVDFQQKTGFQSFVAQHKDLESMYGHLKSLTSAGSVVEGRGSPARWVARVDADLHFEKETLRVVYEFHLEQDRWVLYGYKTMR